MRDERGHLNRVRQRRFAGWFLVAGIILLSVVGVLLLSAEHRRSERENREAEVRRVAAALGSVSTLSVAQLESTAAFLELHPDLSQPEFQRLSRVLLADHPVTAVTYLGPPTGRLGGTADQGEGGSFPGDGNRRFAIKLRSRPGPESLIRPADPATARHLSQVLAEAGREGRPAVTEATALAGREDRHFVVFNPVNDRELETDGGEARPRGYLAGVIRVSDLLSSAKAVASSGTELALVEEDGDVLSSDLEPVDEFVSTPIVIADRQLELRLVVPGREIWMLPLLLGLGGLILALTIGLLILNWSRRERNALELAHLRVEERDRAMKAEAETNRMYRLLAENLTDMVLVADPDTRITYVSPAGERMLGWTPDEMIGHRVLEFLHPEDATRSEEQLAILRDGVGMLTFEHRLRRNDGSYVWVESAVRSILDPVSEELVEFQAAVRDISERKPLQEQLERLAREDPLTGLSNRRQFMEMLTSELARAERSGEGGSMLLIDIDHFKRVNDSYGHLAGDRVLRRVARVMRSRMRVSDTLARLGGDEFAAILPHSSLEEGLTVAESVMAGLRDVMRDEPDLPDVTVSIGIASFEAGEGITPDDIYERADLALYRAKAEGRNRAAAFSPELRQSR